MIVVRVSSQEFEEELQKLQLVHAFNSPLFALLNNLWVDEIHFLLFKTTKVELGVILGERNNTLLSQWSAPFGGFVFKDDTISIESLQNSIKALTTYTKQVNCISFTITLPPPFYSSNFLTKLFFVLGSFTSPKTVDINYHFDLLIENTLQSRNRNFKRNLKIGEDLGLQLYLCQNNEEKSVAYKVIEENRTTQGYPLRMGFEQLVETSRIIPIDFFLLQSQTETYASAICYWVAADICQVVYWGDYTFKRGSGAMQQLSLQLCEHYRNHKVRFLDVGPSSENGVPNHGLCDFKENIGCDVTLKYTYTITIDKLV